MVPQHQTHLKPWSETGSEKREHVFSNHRSLYGSEATFYSSLKHGIYHGQVVKPALEFLKLLLKLFDVTRVVSRGGNQPLVDAMVEFCIPHTNEHCTIADLLQERWTPNWKVRFFAMQLQNKSTNVLAHIPMADQKPHHIGGYMVRFAPSKHGTQRDRSRKLRINFRKSC